VAISGTVTSAVDESSAAVSTSNQLLTSDVSSSLIQSVTTGRATTTTEFTTTLPEAITGTALTPGSTDRILTFDFDLCF